MFIWCISQAGAIAAGCATLIKPSERTPAVCSLLAELIPKYMDPDLVRVVNGGIPEATKVRQKLSVFRQSLSIFLGFVVTVGS
jgi:acyl-CoA reductase-like NAD-dependent aldehyde dehydrogenase